MSKEAYILAADTHTNATWGLCPPKMELDDGNPVQLSRGQSWLWECWNDAIKQAAKLTKGMKRTGFLVGDLGEIDAKNRSNQLITRNKSTALNYVNDALDPFADLCNRIYFIRGTEAHNGKSCWFEEEAAKNFDNTVWAVPEKVASHYQVVGTTPGGVHVDLSHHTRGGGQPWTEDNAANGLAARTVMNYQKRRQVAPDLVVRAHVHVPGDSYENFPTRALILPPFCLKNSYVMRIGQENHALTVGIWVVIAKGGRITVTKFDYSPEKNENVWLKQL